MLPAKRIDEELGVIDNKHRVENPNIRLLVAVLADANRCGVGEGFTEGGEQMRILYMQDDILRGKENSFDAHPYTVLQDERNLGSCRTQAGDPATFPD
jgi:hypothetical protein